MRLAPATVADPTEGPKRFLFRGVELLRCPGVRARANHFPWPYLRRGLDRRETAFDFFRGQGPIAVRQHCNCNVTFDYASFGGGVSSMLATLLRRIAADW